ncbi:MAG: cellulase family glycosylhydrolase [Bacteroidales bacterium]|nr:cellulase family glycosylhydrolase [Bacteroidales bacterium]
MIKRITESNIYYDKNQMAKDLAPVFEKAKALDLPIICTEFGAYNKIDPELRRAYYKDIMEVFRENNVAWSIWDLKGDFGLLLYDRTIYKTIGVDTMVVNAIMK